MVGFYFFVSLAGSTQAMFLLLLIVVPPVDSFTVAVVGAEGGLGRELVQQSVDRGWRCLAGTTKECRRIQSPYREEEAISPPSYLVGGKDSLVVTTPEQIRSFYAFDSLLFAHDCGGDDTGRADSVVRRMCYWLPPSCKRVGMVSYHGLDEARRSQLPLSWLKERYASKWRQESVLDDLESEGRVLTRVWRERSLSYGTSASSLSTPRQSLAAKMLDWVIGYE